MENKDKGTPYEWHDMKDGRRRLRVQFDLTFNRPGVEIEGESITQPDMTMRLGTLLEHHSRGGELPAREPVYFETEIPTFSDLTDVERYKERLKERLYEVEEFLKAEEQDESESKDESKADLDEERSDEVE